MLCCSLIISRSRGSNSYIKITLKGISSGNCCEKEGERSISRKEKYGEFFQWKSWSSEMCERVTVKGRSARFFYGNKRSPLLFHQGLRHTPPYFHWNFQCKGCSLINKFNSLVSEVYTIPHRNCSFPYIF